MTTTPTKTRESGFTLLELLLVIGVAALLLIGGIATYRLVSDGNKATESTRLLLTLRQEAGTMAQQQGGTYDGIVYESTSAATDTPLVTSGVLRVGQRNPFNGDITIGPGATPQQLSITFANISQSACAKLIQAINNGNEVISVTANSTALATFPITAAAASGACVVGANEIIWLLP